MRVVYPKKESFVKNASKFFTITDLLIEKKVKYVENILLNQSESD